MQINLATEHIEDIKKALQEAGQAEKIIVKSINSSLPKIKKDLISNVLDKYYIDKNELMKSFILRRATPNTLSASIISRSKTLQLYKHKVDIRAGKIYASVRKDKSPVLREGAFIRNVKSFKGNGEVSETDIRARVFKASKGRLIALSGASIPGLLNNDGIGESVLKSASYFLEERVRIEMLKKLGG